MNQYTLVLSRTLSVLANYACTCSVSSSSQGGPHLDGSVARCVTRNREDVRSTFRRIDGQMSGDSAIFAARFPLWRVLLRDALDPRELVHMKNALETSSHYPEGDNQVPARVVL